MRIDWVCGCGAARDPASSVLHKSLQYCANFVGSMIQHSFVANARHCVFDFERKFVSDLVVFSFRF